MFKSSGKGNFGIVFWGKILIKLENRWCVNRAFDGDRVCVRLLK